MDPQLSKIAFLCNQLQSQCKKNNSLRTFAIDSLEEILRKFETISTSKTSKPTKATKETSNKSNAKTDPVKVETKTQKKEETLPQTSHNAPGYYTKIPPITSTASVDSVVPYEEEPQEIKNDIDHIDLNASWGPNQSRGRGLASLAKPVEKSVEEPPKPIPTAMVSSLGYLLGGAESTNSPQSSGGKLRDPSPYSRRPTANVASEPASSYPTLRNNGKSASASNIHDLAPISPVAEYHPRFRYSQASPEEKEALERKFRAQNELRSALMSQMEERKDSHNARRSSRS